MLGKYLRVFENRKILRKTSGSERNKEIKRWRKFYAGK
jgi:hypothetical protein